MTTSGTAFRRSLSERQRAAATRIGQDVCVVAGPGSGKTSVLIERFAWLVTECDVDPRRVLAITFTEKAATEIKQRLVARFAGDRAMREAVEHAYVSTVHAFCARLLRENAIAAGIDPLFEVLDFAPARSLLRRTADEALESIYASAPDRMRRFLRSLAVVTERDNAYVPDLAQSLMDIYDAMRVAGVAASESLIDREPDNFDNARLRALLRAVADDRPRINTDNQRAEHAELRDVALEYLELPDEPTREHFRILDGPLTDKSGKKEAINKGRLVKGSISRESFDEIRALAKRVYTRLLLNFYAPERALIVESLHAIDTQYRASKRARSVLDFDDLEEQVIRLLSSDDALRRRVSNQFDYILMDELQDTNPLQWKLLDLIRREHNFFAVGDVNQSIFGFRHAEPQLFNGYRAALHSAGLAVDELRDNYRSRPELLSAVNTVFAGAPGIDPHELTACSPFSAKDSPSVESICALARTNGEAEQIEAEWVAQRITEIVGTLRLNNGELARYGDIAILTRSNMATGRLQTALDLYGVPSVVLGGLTLYDTREIGDLILLLSVIVNPLNEIALAGLLRSPIFGLTDEDLLRLTLTGTLSEAVEADPPQRWEVIAELREIRNRVSPDMLLRRALDATGYETGLSSRARSNIEKVLAGLRNRYASNPAPLSEVLSDLQTAAPDSEAPPAEFGNAVRLMTIHKSKGLEFPIVFLPFLHVGRNNDFPVVSYSHDHGLGVKWRDPHFRTGQGDSIWLSNKARIDQRQIGEDNRVLYVGLTRAQEHMVLSFCSTKYSNGKWAELVSQRLDIAVDHPLNQPVERTSRNLRTLVVDRAPVRGEFAATRYTDVDRTVTLTPPGPGRQYDSTASVTSVSLFQQCPRKYYLSRYLGWPDPTSRPDTIAASEAGDLVVADDAEFDGTELEASELSASELGLQVHSLLAGAPVPDASSESLELASRFRLSPLGQKAAKASRIWHEFDFVFALDDVVLRGQIDLIFESRPGSLVVVDYKTDRVMSPIPAERIQAYEVQLQLYALAIERAFGQLPSEAWLHFLRPHTSVEIDLSPLALNAARAAVRELAEAQDTLDFPLREGPHCFRCGYRAGICPAGLPASDVIAIATPAPSRL